VKARFNLVISRRTDLKTIFKVPYHFSITSDFFIQTNQLYETTGSTEFYEVLVTNGRKGR
jgi:hypothetical protein